MPPQRLETTKGILWWKKSSVVFHTAIPSPDLAVGCGISMFRALASEFPNRRKIESISAMFVGDVEATFHAYESFTNESDKNDEIASWLLEKVPYFTLSFETTDGQIIRCYDYETLDGKRVVATSRPMDADEELAARDRVLKGLRTKIQEA